jgi:hypothetical protein
VPEISPLLFEEVSLAEGRIDLKNLDYWMGSVKLEYETLN